MDFNVNFVTHTQSKEILCHRLTVDTESGQISIMNQHIDMITTIKSGAVTAFDNDMNILETHFLNSGIISYKNNNCTIIANVI